MSFFNPTPDTHTCAPSYGSRHSPFRPGPPQGIPGQLFAAPDPRCCSFPSSAPRKSHRSRLQLLGLALSEFLEVAKRRTQRGMRAGQALILALNQPKYRPVQKSDQWEPYG